MQSLLGRLKSCSQNVQDQMTAVNHLEWTSPTVLRNLRYVNTFLLHCSGSMCSKQKRKCSWRFSRHVEFLGVQSQVSGLLYSKVAQCQKCNNTDFTLLIWKQLLHFHYMYFMFYYKSQWQLKLWLKECSYLVHKCVVNDTQFLTICLLGTAIYSAVS